MGCRLCELVYLRINDSVVILLACIFFCLTGHSLALAADAAAPLVAAEVSGRDDKSEDVQADGVEAGAIEKSAVVAGRVYFIAGEVQAVGVSGEVRQLRKEDRIYVGDTLISATGASAYIRMEDGGLIALHAESQLKFDNFKFRGKEDGTEYSSFTLGAGGFRAVTGLIGRNNPQSYRITTPAANIGIMGGTDHEILYLADDVPGALAGTYSKVNSGETTLSNDLGQVNVAFNQMGYIGSIGQSPQLVPINRDLFIEQPDDGFITGGKALTATAPSASTDKSTNVTQDQTVTSDGVGKSAETDEGSMFVPAPILWGGNVSESYRKQKTGNGQSTLQHVQAANLRAQTYIWQPWLVQVKGGLGVVNAKEVTGINATNKNAWLTSRGAVSLVPHSRFPFLASYYVNDSSFGGGTGAAAFVPVTGFGHKNQGFEMRQKYRPQSNSSNSEASYNRDSRLVQLNNSSVEKVSSRVHLRHDYRLPRSPTLVGLVYDRRTRDTVAKGVEENTYFRGRYLTKFSKETLEVNTQHSERKDVQDSSSFNNLAARHAYRPDRQLTITSTGYANQTKLLNANLARLSTRYLQADSSATWQPDEELPFYVFGSVQVSDSVYDTLDSYRTTQNQVANTNVNYAATPNLKYTVRGVLGNTRTETRSNRTTLAGGSADYRSDVIKLGNALRDWKVKGGADYQTSTAIDSDLTIYGEAGQGLRLPYVSDAGPVDFNFKQLLSVRNSGNFGQTNTLTHNAGVSWRSGSGQMMSSGANFVVADIRRFGTVDSQSQTASLGANIQQRTGYSSKTALASLGWATNGLGQSSTRTRIDIKYDHSRAFNVRGLRYDLTFSVAKSQLSRDTDSRDGYTVRQKLEYGIGRLYLRLNAMLAKQGETTNNAIVFELGRSFGDV